MRNHVYIVAGICLLLAFAIGGAALLETKKPAKVINKTSNVAGSSVGGSYEMINQDWEKVTEENYKGTYKLIYFGFTNCPMICPTDLQRNALVMKQLGADGNKILPVFVSTDPERDDPDTVKQFVELFHPRLIGLTGSPDQVKHMISIYKAYSSKVEDDTMNDYMMNHSTYTYLMGPNDELLTVFGSNDTPTEMTEEIKILLKG